MSQPSATVWEVIEALARRGLLRAARGSLVAGDAGAPARGVLVADGVTPSTVERARERDAGLILCRRPPWRGRLRHMRAGSAAAELLSALLGSGAAVVVAGAALEESVPGPADVLAAALGLDGVQPLEPWKRERLFKIVVFVPHGYEDGVRAALAAAGAGHIGNYDSCAFETPGTGTFRPLAGAQPFIGAEGRLERVAEVRLETIVPASRRAAALAAMLAAHPYEEPAYDLIPLANEGPVRRARGRVGELRKALALSELAEAAAAALGGEWHGLGRPDARVRRVAVLAGGGRRGLAAAAAAGAEAVVACGLGDDEAVESPLPVVRASARTARRLIVEDGAARIRTALAEEGLTVPVWADPGEGAEEWRVVAPEGGRP